ncbi:PadR family transcriptional regulator [Sneathiella aquimaris]|uniref:PadR family transcriptional regulator n=1 Tax=Sneathiella aquimaris TaxID=2599305 RepID=UPI00146D1CD0|nr:PadR family transcriptional regulator [Sneathiella aquimaris]
MSTNLREALVGLLLEHPNHAYKLKRLLAPRVSQSETINDGVLYPLLRKLEKEEIISGRKDVSASNRTRTIYSVTPKGRDWFMNWLESDTNEEEATLYDFFLGNPFFVKMQFFDRISKEQRFEKLSAHLQRTNTKLKLFAEIRTGMIERGADQNRIALLDLGAAQQRCTKRWLTEQLKIQPDTHIGK